jgi:hypothetical protein
MDFVDNGHNDLRCGIVNSSGCNINHNVDIRSHHRYSMAGSDRRQAQAESETRTVLGFFFWLLLVLLVAALIIYYVT